MTFCEAQMLMPRKFCNWALYLSISKMDLLPFFHFSFIKQTCLSMDNVLVTIAVSKRTGYLPSWRSRRGEIATCTYKGPWGWNECKCDELYDEFHMPKIMADIINYDSYKSHFWLRHIACQDRKRYNPLISWLFLCTIFQENRLL